jgi:hypothetical protein
MDWNKVRAFLKAEAQKEKSLCTYELFLEEIRSIQLPKWKLVGNKIRAADDSHRSPIQVLASFFSVREATSPKECAAALNLEIGEDLAIVIMKAENGEWLEEPVVQRIRKDLLSATGLNDEDGTAGILVAP